MLEEFSEKQDDITLNGDESVKQEYLEETSEDTIKQEDQQEDGITVESVDDDDDDNGVEHEFEIGGIESDYNGSVASDNDEPETAAGPSNEPVNENDDNDEDEAMEIDETPMSDKEISDKENEVNQLKSTREQFKTLLESVIRDKAPKHLKNVPDSMAYYDKSVKQAQATVDEATICRIVLNYIDKLTKGEIEWKTSLKLIASELKSQQLKRPAEINESAKPADDDQPVKIAKREDTVKPLTTAGPIITIDSD